MRRLMAEKEDDLLRHRLALAAACLAEVPVECRDSWADAVTTAVYDGYWGDLWDGRAEALPHFEIAWAAVGAVNGRVRGKPLIDLLCDGLRKESLRCKSAEALGRMGPMVARYSEVLLALLIALHDPDWRLSESVAEALGRIGEAAARYPKVLPTLVAALADPCSNVRWSAALALGSLGEEVTRHAGALPALLTSLRDHNSNVRGNAAWALERMRIPAAYQPEVVRTLLAGLSDPVDFVRTSAALAVAGLADQVARQPEVLPIVLSVLREPHCNVPKPVARGLERLADHKAAHDPEVLRHYMEFLPSLLAELHGEDYALNSSEILQEMGEVAARSPAVLSHLLRALCNPNLFLGKNLADARERMGVAAEHTDDLPIFVAIDGLGDSDSFVRGGAVDALGEMGEATPRNPNILSALLKAVCDPVSLVRASAAQALGRVGRAGVRHTELLAALLDALRDPEADVRGAGAESLGQMPEVVAQHPEALTALLKALREPNHNVRQKAAVALGRIQQSDWRLFSTGTTFVLRSVSELSRI
jgi:HEAT repeat protein